MTSEWLSLLLGPAGVAVGSLWLVSRLWIELQAERAAHAKTRSDLTLELDREKDARLEDSRETSDALLTLQARVIRAVELFEERPCIAQGFRQELPTSPHLEPPAPPIPPSLIPIRGRGSGEPSPGA